MKKRNIFLMLLLVICLSFTVIAFAACNPAPIEGAPGEPSLTVTAGDRTVRLQWKAPANKGDSEIIKYEVQRDKTGGNIWIDAGLEMSYTFNELTNDTAYTFKVRAVNSQGEGSIATKTVTPKKGQTIEIAVDSIKVKTKPTKTEYFKNEVFSVEGGVILITYTDGSNADLAMTDPDVEVTEPNMSKTGKKNVTVTYQSKKNTFEVEVVEKGLTVSFSLNYENAPAPLEQNVLLGYAVKEPALQIRTDYTFYNWYADKECTVLYDFENPVLEDITVYAQWKEDGATYYTVSYHLNYYGNAHSSYDQIVKAGETAIMLTLTPSRIDYTFDSWSASEVGDSTFDITKAITSNTDVYAKWTKSKTGSSTYVFEAEDVDLSDKSGPGYSGANAGRGMIVTNANIGASGNKYVAYQCRNGNSLEFYIACDEKVTNAVLTVRFAAEYSSMTLTPSNYQISVNNTAIQYNAITLTLPENVFQSNFADFTIGEVTLNKGKNLIQVKTTNNDELGGTLEATAPIIDCIKITTDAVAIWDGNYGLPQKNY